MRTTINNAVFVMMSGLGMLASSGGCAGLVGVTELGTGGASGTGGQGGTGGASSTGGQGGTGGASSTGGQGGTGDCESQECCTPSDPLDDNNECTDDQCIDGTTSHTAVAAGVACSEGDGQKCNGFGACVQCLDNGDCPPNAQLCSALNQCVCDNGMIQLAAGGRHTCGIKAIGSVWCWGDNEYGQMGDGTTDSPKPSPIQVASLGTSAVEIAAGDAHTCARKTDGSVWCWGSNGSGGVGDGTTATPQPAPVQVAALGIGAVEIAAGGAHTCARKGNGTVWCWGANSRGQIGDGTQGAGKTSPVQVAALGTSAVEIATGGGHTCARTADGTVWCWGGNDHGQVGDGTTGSNKLLPVQVTALGTDALGIAAGNQHTCARTADGMVWCWGENSSGRVGDGTTDSPKPTPVQVVSLGTGAVEVVAGVSHTCARKADGSVWCWGANYGQIGDGTTDSPKLSPIKVAVLGTDAVEISAEYYHTCARKTGGSVWCWGDNYFGQVGDGTTDSPKPSPVEVISCP